MLSVLLPLLGRFWPYLGMTSLALLAWHFDARAVANADAMRIQAAQFREAQANAASMARLALLNVQAEYSAKATEANNAYQIQLASAHGAADRYIAGHRVQSCTFASAPGAAPAAPENHGATVPAGMPADAVVVSANDVQTCSTAVTYGLKARDFVLSISAPAKPAAEPTDGN